MGGGKGEVRWHKGRVSSGSNVHLHSQGGNYSPKGLDRHVVTMGAISVPHYKIVAFHWQHFTSRGFT